MRDKIVSSINARLIDEVSPRAMVRFLCEIPPETYIDSAISVVYTYTSLRGPSEPPALFSEVVCAIGRGILKQNRIQTNSSKAARAGAFVLYSFEALGLIKTEKKNVGGKHAAYAVVVLAPGTLSKLWLAVPRDRSLNLPLLEQPPDWEDMGSGERRLIKTQSKKVQVSLDTHPMLFESANRAQRKGWKVNQGVLPIAQWGIRNKIAAFDDIWTQIKPQAVDTKLREAETVCAIAEELGTKVFYH